VLNRHGLTQGCAFNDLIDEKEFRAIISSPKVSKGIESERGRNRHSAVIEDRRNDYNFQIMHVRRVIVLNIDRKLWLNNQAATSLPL
jgi:hypothetical protein